MQFRRDKKRKSFYLIATSDIAFLLLIFLVVTSSLEYSQEIKPPETPYTEVLDNQPSTITLEITREGKYAMLSYIFGLEKLDLMLANITLDSVVKIYADQEVDFIHITKLLDKLQSLGRTDVFLMMQKKGIDDGTE